MRNELEETETIWNVLERTGTTQKEQKQTGPRWNEMKLEKLALERVMVVICSGSFEEMESQMIVSENYSFVEFAHKQKDRNL